MFQPKDRIQPKRWLLRAMARTKARAGNHTPEVGAPASMPDQSPAFEAASTLIGALETSVNISEQETVMHEIGSDASDDEGILKRNFLINYKCKNCGNFFSSTTYEERSD